MCQCVIAKLVVSRFPKDRDIRKQQTCVCCEAENKAWIPGAKPNDYDVVCQRHLTDSDYRPILITDRLNHFGE